MNADFLDNPAWSALTSVHAGFAAGTDNAKRYSTGILQFMACRQGGAGSMMGLDSYTNTGESFYIIGDLPLLPAGWKVENELPCAQMWRKDNNEIISPTNERFPGLVKLEEADAGSMFDLINSVQPGYYLPGTRQLGNYYGIKEKGRLVAMGGERLRMNGFSELSAICTLPGYTGRGHAQQIIAQLSHHHTVTHCISFLQVALSNSRAIRLYEHLGFTMRREIVFTRIKKQY